MIFKNKMTDSVQIESLPRTTLEYLSDSYIFELSEVTILKIGNDQRGNFIVLDKTIFYPQSGGQPSDTGTLTIDEANEFEVTFASFNNDIVHHYVSQELNDSLIGNKANIKINQERRLNNAKNHSAGHLMGSIVEKLAPELVGVKGFHFPEGPNVEFTGRLTSLTSEELIKKTNALLIEDIAKNIKVFETEDESGEKNKNRMINMGDYEGVPCGGTHLKNVNELQEVVVRKVKFNKGLTRISYVFK